MLAGRKKTVVLTESDNLNLSGLDSDREINNCIEMQGNFPACQVQHQLAIRFYSTNAEMALLLDASCLALYMAMSASLRNCSAFAGES